MPPVQFISHKNRQIFLMDFADAYTAAQFSQITDEAKSIVALYQPKSLLALADFTGLDLNANGRKDLMVMIQNNRAHVRCMAIVGLGYWVSVRMTVSLYAMGRFNHRLFKEKSMALKWLASR